MTPTVGGSVPATSTERTLQISTVAGGRELDFVTAGQGISAITAADFRGALIDALRATGIFSSVHGDGPGDYRLETHILAQTVAPGLVESTAQLLVKYRLLDARTDEVIWTGNIYSSKRITLEEELLGYVRSRRALEYAARDNLSQLISKVANAVGNEPKDERSPSLSTSGNPETGVAQ